MKYALLVLVFLTACSKPQKSEIEIDDTVDSYTQATKHLTRTSLMLEACHEEASMGRYPTITVDGLMIDCKAEISWENAKKLFQRDVEVKK